MKQIQEISENTITVPFNGQRVTAVIHDGSAFVALRPICENLGLDWSSQIKSIRRDSVLSQGVVMMTTPSAGGSQESMCIPLEYLNGWLFGIDDSRVKPELKERLIKYKKECYRTLHQYFYRGFSLNIETLQVSKIARDALAAQIRKLRQEEKSMYETVRQVFKLSGVNYGEKNEGQLRQLFALVQDKFHYAITEKVAARIVLERADSTKENMGLQHTKSGRPTKTDVTVAKNYLTEEELKGLENISEQFLLFVESKAFRGQKMTVEEIVTKLNMLLMTNDYPVLYEYDGFVRDQANRYAFSEYEKYKKSSLPKPQRIK